jgi:sugar diacid utilization regulator
MTIVIAMPDATVHPYEMDELLVELAVARQPALKSRLVDVLAPLQDGKDLLRTLEVLFDCGLDRERTTRMLHIHRRTLGYRLRRIRDLTGIQPNTAHGIQLLRSALVATRLPDIPDTDPTGLS